MTADRQSSSRKATTWEWRMVMDDDHYGLRERFASLHGSDPAVRLMLGLDRLFLAQRIRAHPKSMVARMNGDTREGRERLMDVAFGLSVANRSGVSILDRWAQSYTDGLTETLMESRFRELRIPDVEKDDGEDSTLGRLAVFAMGHGDWAEGMTRVVDDIWSDTGQGLIRTSILAGMMITVFDHHSSTWRQMRMESSAEDVYVGMLLDVCPFDSPSMGDELTAMGMDRPPDAGHVAAMTGFLANGMAGDVRLAAATSPMAASGDGRSVKRIMDVRKRAELVMSNAGVMLPSVELPLCDWRVLCALADGTLPPRMIDLSTGLTYNNKHNSEKSKSYRNVIRDGDHMHICDLLARIDFSNPDPARMESILRKVMPSTIIGETVAEDVILRSSYDKRKYINEGSGGIGNEVIYECAIRGDTQGVVAVNALWNLFHTMIPAMVDGERIKGHIVDNDITQRTLYSWPILTGSAVSEALRDFASRSLPERFIAETLSASRRGDGPVARRTIVPNYVGCRDEEPSAYSIGIDWSH